MRFYKTKTDGIVSVSTLNADGDGNLTEEEYNKIVSMLRAMPEGKVLVEDGDDYAYADAPAPGDADEIPTEDALDIVTGEVPI